MHSIFSEFKTPEARFPITVIEQTGANCGIFAAAMAISALTGQTKSETKELANEIELTAKNMGLSTIGEIFDAEAFSHILNYFFTNQNNRYSCNLLAKTIDFDSVETLKQLLEKANEHGVKILLPYYAKNAKPIFPDEKDMTEDGKVGPEKMSHTHWAVVHLLNEQGPNPQMNSTRASFSDARVELLEGRKRLRNKQYNLAHIYASNNALGDTFSWTDYLKENPNNEAELSISNKAAAANIREIYKDQTNEPPKLLQKTNLREKLILIGQK